MAGGGFGGGFLGGLGGGAVGGAVVRLLLDDSQFQAGLTKDEAEFKSSTAAMGASASKFGGAAKAAFAVGGLAAAAFVATSVKAYAEHQQVIAELQGTIERMPQLLGETTQAFADQATALQNLTGFTDEEILSADNVLARFKLTGDQIRQLIPLVLDYAKATGQSAADAATGLGRAMLGNTRALKTIGIDFKATGNTAQDFATIMDLVKAKVGGVAEEFGKTATGQLEIAKAKFNDIQEAVGKQLIPVLTGLLGVVEKLLPVFGVATSNLGALLAMFLAFKGVMFLPVLIERLAAAFGIETAAVAAARLAKEADVAATVADAAAQSGFTVTAAAAAAGAEAEAVAMAELAAASEAAAAAETAAAAGATAFGVAAAALVAGGLFGLLKEFQELKDPGSQLSLTLGDISVKAGRVADSLGLTATAAATATGATQTHTLASNELARSLQLEMSGAAGAANAEAALAFQHKAVAAAAKAQFLAEESLAGGLVGVESAALQVRQGEQALVGLRAQGKQGTQEYSAAVRDQQGNVLALAAAVNNYEAANAKSPATTATAIHALEALGAKFGLTKGQIDNMAGSATHAIGVVNGVQSALNGLHDKDVTINVTTIYRTKKNSI